MNVPEGERVRPAGEVPPQTSGARSGQILSATTANRMAERQMRLTPTENEAAKQVRDNDKVGEARDIIPTMAAIEAILLLSRQPVSIYPVALEKLARKGCGMRSSARTLFMCTRGCALHNVL